MRSGGGGRKTSGRDGLMRNGLGELRTNDHGGSRMDGLDARKRNAGRDGMLASLGTLAVDLGTPMTSDDRDGSRRPHTRYHAR